MTESSDDSDNESSLNGIAMDSARAEKIFSHRRHQKPMTDVQKNQPNDIEKNRTLFRLSDSDTSHSSSQG